jgi:hypothetical protein
MEHRTCSKCHQSFPDTTEYFSRNRACKSGLNAQCKACDSAHSRTYYQQHRETLLAQNEAYRREHKEEIRLQKREYGRTHGQERLARQRSYTQRARERINFKKAQYVHRLRSQNPRRHLEHAISNMIWWALRKNKAGRPWTQFVDYTLGELMQHLESQFQLGMTWDNYGEWHIDHIRPKSSFTFTSADDPQFKECWALSNLQPLWAKDNLSKGTKIA